VVDNPAWHIPLSRLVFPFACVLKVILRFGSAGLASTLLAKGDAGVLPETLAKVPNLRKG
jgi:hypothetical protein